MSKTKNVRNTSMSDDLYHKIVTLINLKTEFATKHNWSLLWPWPSRFLIGKQKSFVPVARLVNNFFLFFFRRRQTSFILCQHERRFFPEARWGSYPCPQNQFLAHPLRPHSTHCSNLQKIF